jgi:hypothetical protein
MKACNICKLEKDWIEFNKNKAQKDGHQTSCRQCQKDMKARKDDSQPKKSSASTAQSVSHMAIPSDAIVEIRKELDKALAMISSLRKQQKELEDWVSLSHERLINQMSSRNMKPSIQKIPGPLDDVDVIDSDW